MREHLQICATARRSVTTFSHDPFVVASRRVACNRVVSIGRRKYPLSFKGNSRSHDRLYV